MPQTDDELWWWVVATWGIRIPRISVCPDHCAPFDAFADAFFARHPVAIWKASRGFGGKTMLLSILGMSELVALGAFVTILGGSGAQSQRVHETMTEAWNYEGSPGYMLAREPTKFDTYLTNGGKARTLMASTKSVRGPHPQRMRLDEIDEMDLNVLESAQGQPMRKWGIETQTVMSSTHQYPEGTMTEMIRRAAENRWPVYSWCYKETSFQPGGWLLPDEVERKKREIPAHMWAAEYELQEPNFQGRAIDGEKVDEMFNPELGIFEGAPGTYIEIESPKYDRDYITGADWAKEKDFTVIETWDTTDEVWKLVAFERLNRMPWPVMVGRLNKRWQRFGGKVIHDATGIGNVVEDFIEFPRYAKPGDLEGVILAGRQRADMVTNYISGIERGLLRAPRIKYMYDEHRLATTEDMYGGGSSTAHLPDSVCAGLVAWKKYRHWKRPTGIPDLSMKRPRSPWRL
jgi:hypothetical protein